MVSQAIESENCWFEYILSIAEVQQEKLSHFLLDSKQTAARLTRNRKLKKIKNSRKQIIKNNFELMNNNKKTL